VNEQEPLGGFLCVCVKVPGTQTEISKAKFGEENEFAKEVGKSTDGGCDVPYFAVF
jgi:hypothetical protein